MSKEETPDSQWIKQGSLVQHKAGGPTMVIKCIYDCRKDVPIADRAVNCTWWDEEKNTFPAKDFRTCELKAVRSLPDYGYQK